MRLFLNDIYQFSMADPVFSAGTIRIFRLCQRGKSPVTISFSDLSVYSVSYILPTPSPLPSWTPIPRMTHQPMKNKLNELDPKTWLKFQKSWFIHNPPPRKKDVLVHPAKFPETMAQEFIEFFTKRGENVLDPDGRHRLGAGGGAAGRAERLRDRVESEIRRDRRARAWPKNARRWASPPKGLTARHHYRGCRAGA